MSKPSDLVQGTLEMLLLKILALEPMNGFAVSQRLQQVSGDVLQVSDGSLYPALHKPEQEGWITAEWKTSEYGRRAKYLLSVWFGALVRLLRSQKSLLLENLVLRQQLAVLKRRHPRPTLSLFDKLFWVVVRRLWPKWKEALIVVTPETVVRWHRTGFQMYWRWISKVRKQAGRRPIPKEVRQLIFRMVPQNPTWGAPRIHGELLMLGFDLSERTISRWMKQAPRNSEPAKRWLAFCAQPSGGHRRDGLLLRSHNHIRRTLLLFRDRS